MEKHKDNPPKFIEIGNISTRIDGTKGYANLHHDHSSGLILINSQNIEKILKNKEPLKEYLKKMAFEKETLEKKPEKSDSEQEVLKILSLIPQEIFKKSQDEKGFDENDVTKILQAHNKAIERITNQLKEVTGHFDVPLVRNTRNGHCANMSIVNGGLNYVSVQDGKLTMTMKSLSTTATQSSAKQLSVKATIQNV